MTTPYYIVDAFTSIPFAGNPAAVCYLTTPRSDNWMQATAEEMNLSETAFLHPTQEGYNLRWFTPQSEVDLCGHATLASARVLWESGYLAAEATAVFQTRSGILTAERKEDWIQLDFPADPPEKTDFLASLPAVLGVAPSEVVGVRKCRFAILVELVSETLVVNLKPDLQAIQNLGSYGTIVTSYSESADYDFISRFFAPQVGIPEDPVTGAAHCCLGPYWQERLQKDTFLAYQASRRGGVVQVEVQGERIRLGGQAVTVAKGELLA